MNKNNYSTVKLEKGEMHVYDCGKVKLHAYRTDDLISDEVFILEKNGQAVIIEPPCFFDNIAALNKYISNMHVIGIFVAYHGAGASFLPQIPKYATQRAKDYATAGGGKALIDNFSDMFGKIFDSSVHEITNIIKEGKVTLAGIDFIIKQTAEAFDVEIPEINAVYTHMLGHDCHSIVAGSKHADALIEQLSEYIEKGYSLILTSHYTPEDLKDAQTKIDYLKRLKDIAASCYNSSDFKLKVKKQFPKYGGANYLDMTADMFFA